MELGAPLPGPGDGAGLRATAASPPEPVETLTLHGAVPLPRTHRDGPSYVCTAEEGKELSPDKVFFVFFPFLSSSFAYGVANNIK